MFIEFLCYGHKNLQASHRNTIEFTKDKELSLRGDCIIGVNSDYKLADLKALLKYEKIKIKITVDNWHDEFTCKVNKKFNDPHEIVFRRSDYISDRTLGISCDKAAIDVSDDFRKLMKKPEQKMKVRMSNV